MARCLNSLWAKRVTIATGTLLIGDQQPSPIWAPVHVMFMAAPWRTPRARDDMHALALERRQSAFLLNLAPGHEREGPKGLDVFHLQEDGTLDVTTDCVLRTGPSGTVSLIASESAFFGFNGQLLLRGPGSPVKDDPAGVKKARELIRKLARKVDLASFPLVH